MKIILIILSLTLFFSRAFAFPLLSANEFQKLDKKQKVEYISGLQKIFVQMAERSPLIAGSENSNSNRQPANAGTFFPEEISTASASTFTGADTKKTKAKTDSPKSYVPVEATLSPGEILVETETLKPATKAPAQKARKITSTTTKKSSPSDFRCMHSGWIIEGEKCQAPDKVPETWGFEYILRDIHKCETGLSLCNPLIFGLQLPQGCSEIDKCSREAKAFCSSDTLKPTSDCYRQANANNKSGTQVAAALLSDVDKSNTFFEEYKTKLNHLCHAGKLEKNYYMNNKAGKKRSADSKKNAIQDVLSTCEWAKKQLQELNSKVVSSGKSGQSSPGSATPPQQGSQK
jgi:hypothetical protein